MSAASNGTALRAESLGEALRLLDGSALQVREDACVNVRGRVGYCTRCSEACPADALTPGCDDVGVDEDACTGCGACVPACPAGALSLSGFDPGRFLDALGAQPLVHLHCAEGRDGGGGVVLPCFRLLDERLVAAALAQGVRMLVLHGLEGCAGCVRGSAVESIGRTRDALHRWFGDAAPALAPASDRERGAGRRRRLDQPVIGRRGFMRVAGGQGAARAVIWTLPLAAEGGPAGSLEDALAFFQAENLDQRPEPYQAALAAAAPTLPWCPDAVLPFRLRAIGEACSACRACGERCPTGALTARDEGTRRELWFDPRRCTDCELCERVCPHEAITVTVAQRPADVVAGTALVMERTLARCTRCGLPDEAGVLEGGTCPQCRNEQEMDDEWQCMLDG